MTEVKKTLQLQERDLQLLRGLFESRVMTLDHISALHFDGKREMAKKRARKLKSAGYLAERPRHASSPAVLYITKESLALLHKRGDLSQYPKLSKAALLKRSQVSDMTLKHELEVMSVKAAIVSTVRETDRFSVEEFTTWPLLNQFSVRRHDIDRSSSREVIVKPDGFIRIREREPDGGESEYTFFLELDRSSETQDILARKARCYLEHYRSGGFAMKCGHPRTDYKKFPFLVLFVCKSAERRDNTIRRLLENNPPTLTQTWLTTFSEVTANPLGPIWIRPRDHRETSRAGSKSPEKQVLLGSYGLVS